VEENQQAHPDEEAKEEGQGEGVRNGLEAILEDQLRSGAEERMILHPIIT
jgi:hypothetical protein